MRQPGAVDKRCNPRSFLGFVYERYPRFSVIVEVQLVLDPGRLPMNMSDMTHRVTDAIKRMTDRLTHRKESQPQQASDKRNTTDIKK